MPTDTTKSPESSFLYNDQIFNRLIGERARAVAEAYPQLGAPESEEIGGILIHGMKKATFITSCLERPQKVPLMASADEEALSLLAAVAIEQFKRAEKAEKELKTLSQKNQGLEWKLAEAERHLVLARTTLENIHIECNEGQSISRIRESSRAYVRT